MAKNDLPARVANLEAVTPIEGGDPAERAFAEAVRTLNEITARKSSGKNVDDELRDFRARLEAVRVQ